MKKGSILKLIKNIYETATDIKMLNDKKTECFPLRLGI
jgi:hypothetical protein